MIVIIFCWLICNMLLRELLSFFYRNLSDTDHFSSSLEFFQFSKISDPLKNDWEIFNAVPNVLDNRIRKPIILTLTWKTYMELTTRESEILPLFLSSSLLFGIKMYKTFYRSPDCCVIWHWGWVTIIIVNKYSFKTAF